MDSYDDLVDIAALQALLGVSRSRAYALSQDSTFPEPAIIRTRFRAWQRNAVEAWLDLRRPGWRRR